MFITKLKFATAVLLALTILGTGAGVATFNAVAGNQSGGSGSTAAPGSVQAKGTGDVAITQAPGAQDVPKKADTKPTPAIRNSRDLRRLLSQPTELREIPEGTPLREALDLLSEKYGITIRIDYADLVRTGFGDPKGFDQQQVGLRAGKKASLAVALEDLLSQLLIEQGPSSVTYMVKGNQVVIVPGSRLLPAEQGGTALSEPVQVHAEGTTLEEALRDLAEATGANIVLDVRLAEKAQARVSASLQHVPLETAVRLLADMADVKAVAVQNVIYVTTKENADKWLKEQRERELGFDPATGGNPFGPGMPGGGLGGFGGAAAPTPGAGGTPTTPPKNPPGGVKP